MTEPTVTSPPPVLNYDLLNPARRDTKRMGRGLLILVCAGIGWLVGLGIRPASYTSTGYFGINANPTQPLLATPATIQGLQDAHVTALRSQQCIAAGVAAAKANGVTLTPAEVNANLRLRVVADSKLIEVSYSNFSPTVATAVVSGVMNSYVAGTPNVIIIAAPAIPSKAQHETMFGLGGLIVGLLIGCAIAVPGWR